MAATKSLAIVTGASTGIGYELAKLCAENGFDLVVAADENEIHAAAERLQSLGASVEAAFGVCRFLFWLGRLTYTSPRLLLQTNSASQRCLNACGGGRESCRAEDGSVQKSWGVSRGEW